MAIACNLNITLLFVLFWVFVCSFMYRQPAFPRTNHFVQSIIFCETVYMLITVAAFGEDSEQQCSKSSNTAMGLKP